MIRPLFLYSTFTFSAPSSLSFLSCVFSVFSHFHVFLILFFISFHFLVSQHQIDNSSIAFYAVLLTIRLQICIIDLVCHLGSLRVIAVPELVVLRKILPCLTAEHGRAPLVRLKISICKCICRMNSAKKIAAVPERTVI